MKIRFLGPSLAAAFGSLFVLTAAQSPRKPEADLLAIVKAYLAAEMSTDWADLDKLPSVKWAARPVTMLQNCLPDGGCFTRQGTATVGGKSLTVVVTGARTIVSYLYLRNRSTPIGEAAVLSALNEAGLAPQLARCPVKTGTGGTNWYRVKGGNPGVLSIQTSCGGKPCEGFVLSRGEELPALQPNQLSLYSEQCGTDVAQREPVSLLKPHEQLAQTIVSLLTPASGPALHDWKTLAGLSTGITWFGEGPTKASLTYMNDPNPLMQTGQVAYSGRKFSVIASGTQTQVKTIYFEEGGLHPRGEHLLGVVYEKGLAVKLVRCGPIYTESTNNWYSLTSARTRTAMIRQSIRYEGDNVQDSYAVRLDGTLPTRDPRDRDPGVNGCR